MLNGTTNTRKPASYARSSVKVKEAGGENKGTEGSADLSETGFRSAYISLAGA